MGWHRAVINAIGIFLAGEMDCATSSDVRNEIFRAGDSCTAEERTGLATMIAAAA